MRFLATVLLAVVAMCSSALAQGGPPGGGGWEQTSEVGLIQWKRFGAYMGVWECVVGVANPQQVTMRHTDYFHTPNVGDWIKAQQSDVYPDRQPLKLEYVDATFGLIDQFWVEWHEFDPTTSTWQGAGLVTHYKTSLADYQTWHNGTYSYADYEDLTYLYPASQAADWLAYGFYAMIAKTQTEQYAVELWQEINSTWVRCEYYEMKDQAGETIDVSDVYVDLETEGQHSDRYVLEQPYPLETEDLMINPYTHVGHGSWILYRRGDGWHHVQQKLVKFDGTNWVTVEAAMPILIRDGSTYAVRDPVRRVEVEALQLGITAAVDAICEE